MKSKYKRIIVKLSGEALAGEKGMGFDWDVVNKVVDQIVKVKEMGVEVAIVVGGGNFWRGRQNTPIKTTRSLCFRGKSGCVPKGTYKFGDIRRDRAQKPYRIRH